MSKVVFGKKLLLIALVPLSLIAATKEQLEDRVIDLEAQVATLNANVTTTKALAEQERPSAFNPSISVIGDILGQYGLDVKEHPGHKHGDHEHSFSNGVSLRELEFEFRASIDQVADALVAVAVEQHEIGKFKVSVEEAYARFKGWSAMEIRVGKFKTAIGRMNRIHLHNLPHITYPLAIASFLGGEGFASHGISLNSTWSFSEKTALTWFLEGVMGEKLAMQEKEAREVPQGIAHLWLHHQLSSAHFLDIGHSNVFGRKGKSKSGLFWLTGADIHYSYLPEGYGPNPYFLFGAEFFLANKSENGRWPLGGFSWAQLKMWGSSFIGVRYDIAPDEKHSNEYQHALAGYLSYYPSEFLRFRLGYEHVMPELGSFAGDHRFMLSLNFVLGSHPVEPYYANR